jgi:hypothetical protein
LPAFAPGRGGKFEFLRAIRAFVRRASGAR